MPEEKKASPVKYFLCGGFGGICSVLSGHPLDTIKVRLQTMPAPAPGQPPLYKGTFDCASKTIKNEGIRGLYKGMSAPLTGVAPIFAVSFFGYGLGKRLLQQTPNQELNKVELTCAGSFSGALTSSIMAPGERIKCLLQIQQGEKEKKYNGMADCAKKLYKEGGIRSLYKGLCATLLRDIPATGMYFLTYEYVKELAARRSGKEATLLETVFAGGMAGMSFWILGMPPDVLKSRLQTAPEGTYKHGIRSVFKELMIKDGPLALYRGVVPVMLRAFPANAATFFGFEIFMQFLNKYASFL